MEANGTYFKFMFVRHPMDRMLSCYMEKMVKASHHSSVIRYRKSIRDKGRQIIQKRQSQLSQQQSNSSVDFKVANESSTTLTQSSLPAALTNDSIYSNVTVTFEEFLEYVLSTDLQGKLCYWRVLILLNHSKLHTNYIFISENVFKVLGFIHTGSPTIASARLAAYFSQ